MTDAAATDGAGGAGANRIEALLVRSLARHEDELDALRGWALLRNDRRLFPRKGMYDWLEAQILYLLLRTTRPGLVVEVGAGHGYSSGFILLALNRNGGEGRLLSFDLDPEAEPRTRANLAAGGIDSERLAFVRGDVRETSERALPAGRGIDVLFLDAEHTREFASWYLRSLVPRVRPDGLVHVHDVLPYGVPPQIVDEGEGEVVWDYLRDLRLPAGNWLYVGELVRTQPLRAEPLRRLARYPFGDRTLGTDGVEQSPSLWFFSS